MNRFLKSLPLLFFMFAFYSGSGKAPQTTKEQLDEKVVQANVIEIEARIMYENALKRNIELKKNRK